MDFLFICLWGPLLSDTLQVLIRVGNVKALALVPCEAVQRGGFGTEKGLPWGRSASAPWKDMDTSMSHLCR